jgi:predicted  nucleic acid-binding Zn-ribbon protein
MKHIFKKLTLLIASGLFVASVAGCKDDGGVDPAPKAEVDALKEQVKILETFKTWAEGTVSTLGGEDTDLEAQIEALNKALAKANSEIATMGGGKEEIEAMKKKMNALLAGSTLTVAQIEAKLKAMAEADYQSQIDALKKALDGIKNSSSSSGNGSSQELTNVIRKVAALQAYIDGLPKDLVGKADLEAWFQANHGSDIKNLDEALRALIAEKADASALTSLEETLSALEGIVAGLAARIESMALSRIQSIVYMPEFDHGRHPVTGSVGDGVLLLEPFTMNFLISPAGGAALFDGAGTFEGVFNSVATTRAMAGTVPATFVSATEEGVLTLSFAPEAIPVATENTGMQIALRARLETGENLSSDFVTLRIAMQEYSYDVALRSLPTQPITDLVTLYKTTLRFEVSNAQTPMTNLGVTASQAWTVGQHSDGGGWTTYGDPGKLQTITKESDLAAGEMYLCYDAAENKSYLLVGPQIHGLSDATLFAMNAAGTDKQLFDRGGSNTGALYVVNVGANYEVQLPQRKALDVMIYGWGGIDNKDNPAARTRYGVYPAIPGVYDDTAGYNFTDVALSSLYDFKPADAEFVFTFNKDDQNFKTAEQWGGNLKWNETNGTLTLSNRYELSNYNTLNKKIGELNDADKPGIYFSWTFKAGEDAELQSSSTGNERWFFKDPVRNPGEYMLYFGYDKQPCATGVFLGTDGNGAGANPIPYNAVLADAAAAAGRNKFGELKVGDLLYVGEALGKRDIWKKGVIWDVHGGPDGAVDFTQTLPLAAPLALPALIEYDDAAKCPVITAYCKKYFCKTKGVLRLHLQGNDANDHFEVVDAEKFIIRVTSLPTDHGNIQLRIQFDTDYANQNMLILLAD